METESKVNREEAEREFDQWCAENELPYTEEDMEAIGEETADQLRQARYIIVKAVMAGHMIFNDEGFPVYTPHHRRSKDKNPITFYEQTGATMLAAPPGNSKRGPTPERKLFAMLEDITKTGTGRFSGLAGVDLKVCMAVGLFLMV